MQAIAVDANSTPASVLDGAARRFGAREAYVEPATSGPREAITYQQLRDLAASVAGTFVAAGVKPGQVVAICLPASIAFAAACLGAHWCGAIASGINPRLGDAERDAIIGRLDPAVVIVADDAPVLRAVTTIHRREVLAAHHSPQRRHEPDPNDIAAIVWTSGTTGSPKGAVFSNRCLAAVAGGADDLGSPGDIRLSPLPFAHVGYMTRLTDEVSKGITTVIAPTPWKASETLAILEAERITVAQGVPTQWALLAREPEFATRDLSSLRVAGTGAAPMDAALVRVLRDRLGVPIVVRYTSTESSLGAGTRPDDPPELVATSVGRAVAGAVIEVRDDDGALCETGAVGRIWISSKAAMVGYLDRVVAHPDGAEVHLDEALTATVKDALGWIRTGDFASSDDSGNLFLFGRDNDLYLRGGYNVYPVEVEHALVTHRSVHSVCVLGAPDPVLGEVGVAVVVPTDPASPPQLAELQAHLRAVLADYKAPDALVIVDQLPMTPMMKVDRSQLREAANQAAAGRRRS